jgi:membrane-associated phospholipid phosphatase
LGVVFPSVYVAILSVICIVYKVLPGPEFIALVFFIYAAYNRKTRRFIGDWAPFIFIFLSFEALFGIVGGMNVPPHIQEPITADLRLFGSIPTVILQHVYRSAFLDYLGAFFYSLHLILPVAFGFILWKYSPKNFGKYTLALAIGTYSALVTFLVYPVAPPYIGVNQVYGFISLRSHFFLLRPPVTRILYSVDNNIGIPFFRTIYDYVSSDTNAAFPSLHSMFPWLVSLFALKIKKTKALPIFVLPVGIWFSAVYLGEHYVVDVVGGVIYATIAFLLVEMLVPRINSKLRFAREKSKRVTTQRVKGQ